jgi:hypothetical protein
VPAAAIPSAISSGRKRSAIFRRFKQPGRVLRINLGITSSKRLKESRLPLEGSRHDSELKAVIPSML